MKIKSLKTLLVGSLVLLSGNSFAAEVDSFNGRYKLQNDSLEYINSYTNKLLEDAIKEINEEEKKESCVEKSLYKGLRKKFNNQYQGEFASHIIKTDTINKIHIGTRASVFGGFTVFEAPVQGGTARLSDPMADLLLINGVRMGTDKFEHFFGSGYRYFKTHYLKNEHVAKALLIGWQAETGVLGSMTTGVMSYADMLANFNGMRFWNHMLSKNDDVLGADKNLGPYVECESGKWKVTQNKIDWTNYIDHGFDEGVNCSRIKNKKMLAKVLQRIDLVKQENPNEEFDCPILPNEIEGLHNKYGELSEFLINPYGMNALKDPEWKSVYKSPRELLKKH